MTQIGWLLAQSSSTQPVGGMDVFWRSLFPLILMLVVFYWFLFRGQRRERQKQEDMLNSIKRGDRVLTIGGIYGTVVDIREQELVLKVDETNNVKLRFNRSAVKEIYRDSPPADAPKK